MSKKNWPRDRVLWIAVVAWVVWFASMLVVASGAGSSSAWIALDAVAKSGTEFDLVGIVPAADGTEARVACSAVSWQLPASVEVQNGRARFVSNTPEQTGFHTWSVHPVEGEPSVAVSVGSLAVVAEGDPWIGISIDGILADAPWHKIQTANPPQPYLSTQIRMFELSGEALLVCWSSIDVESLPMLREWWTRFGLPNSILLTEEKAGEALAAVRASLGDPLLCLAGTEAIGSLPTSEIEVIGVGEGSDAAWQTAMQRIEQLRPKGK